jgi:hypothetical protein
MIEIRAIPPIRKEREWMGHPGFVSELNYKRDFVARIDF